MISNVKTEITIVSLLKANDEVILRHTRTSIRSSNLGKKRNNHADIQLVDYSIYFSHRVRETFHARHLPMVV